jgi:hypothetical protein
MQTQQTITLFGTVSNSASSRRTGTVVTKCIGIKCPGVSANFRLYACGGRRQFGSTPATPKSLGIRQPSLEDS